MVSSTPLPTMPPRRRGPPANLTPDSFYELQWRSAKSFASSYRYNGRNLEAHWYGLWQIVLNRLIRNRPDFMVVPQFPLYYVFSDVGDDEERKEGENPDFPDEIGKKDVLQDEIEDAVVDGSGAPPEHQVVEAPILPAHPLPPPGSPIFSSTPPRDFECVINPDASSATMKTVPVSSWRSSSAVPDFCILHSCTMKSKLKDEEKEFRYNALAGIQVTHTCCSFIVENKRAPCRKTDGVDPEKKCDLEVKLLLKEAKDELFDHCVHYFQMYPNSRSVIAIATAGAYWAHKVVLYTNTFEAGEEGQKTENERFHAWSKLTWSNTFEIGTSASDEELAKLEKKVKHKKPWSRQELDDQ